VNTAEQLSQGEGPRASAGGYELARESWRVGLGDGVDGRRELGESLYDRRVKHREAERNSSLLTVDAVVGAIDMKSAYVAAGGLRAVSKWPSQSLTYRDEARASKVS